jgi:hypothetical protein
VSKTTISKILLGDLLAVRIVCRNPKCGAAVEMSLALLANFTDMGMEQAGLQAGRCPVCQAELAKQGAGSDQFWKLRDALVALAAVKDLVQAELVIPEEEDAPEEPSKPAKKGK